MSRSICVRSEAVRNADHSDVSDPPSAGTVSPTLNSASTSYSLADRYDVRLH